MNERRQDFELLQRFTRQGEQSAFTGLVRRHLDLVFATALRKVADSEAAQEVAQNVFAVLARKAWQFAPDDSLPAWLHKAALLEAKSWLRGELGRRRREQTAAELGTTMNTPEDQPVFAALVPLLDEALLSLREKDRTALLLRFYESQSLRDVGATFGVSEDTAQKRVQSALEKLAEFFQRRGFKTATVAATAAALQHTATTASAAVVSAVVSVALQAAPPAITGLGLLLARLARLTKAQKAAVGVVLVVVLLFWLWRDQRHATQGPKLQPIASQLAAKKNGTINLQTNERTMNTTTLTQLSLPLVLSAGLAASNALGPILAQAQPHGQVVVWGSNAWGETNVPPAAQSGVVAIAMGIYHEIALKNDGSVVAWGVDPWGAGTNSSSFANFGQTRVPVEAQNGVIAIAANQNYNMALKNDGRVVAWGWNGSGQTNVPVAAQSGVVAIAAGTYHCLGLKDDGSVVAWGDNHAGQTNVPAAAQSGVVAIAAGAYHSLALKEDGSVVAWGANWFGVTNVPVAAQSGVKAIAAAYIVSLALKNDGSVVAWGRNDYGQTDVPVTAQSGVTAIAVSELFNVALKSDGSVVVWGINNRGQTNVPAAAQSGVKAIAAGVYGHVVALKHDGTVVAWGQNREGQCDVPAGLTGVTAIAAEGYNTMALRGSGWELNMPSADASATVTSTISPNGINATVILDGSRSSDPEGDSLQYTWYEHGAALATGVVAHPVLPVGTHPIVLVVNDGRFSATNAVTVEVITPATAVSRLVRLVENADLGTRNPQPLLAPLSAARSAFERANFTAALNQLAAFQNQVRAQIVPRNPALADQFLTAAQQIIAVVTGR